MQVKYCQQCDLLCWTAGGQEFSRQHLAGDQLIITELLHFQIINSTQKEILTQKWKNIKQD
jgi:hypothetical protein